MIAMTMLRKDSSKSKDTVHIVKSEFTKGLSDK